jgi:hypothetical protein
MPRKSRVSKITLLEEPQAAFYAWIEQAGREGVPLSARVTSSRLVLAAELPISA